LIFFSTLSSNRNLWYVFFFLIWFSFFWLFFGPLVKLIFLFNLTVQSKNYLYFVFQFWSLFF
jgi:hypothetical protein